MKIILLYLKFYYLVLILFSVKHPILNLGHLKLVKILNTGYTMEFSMPVMPLTLSNEKIDGQDVLLASGYGKTIGLARLFFKVEDYYSSYFESKKVQPKLFKEIFTKVVTQKIWSWF